MQDGWARRPPTTKTDALVAHWAFTEGSGYMVHDHVGQHDLQALYEPTWVPLHTNECGDGVVGAHEACDLGKEVNGKGRGCTADCRVEDGWECTAGPPAQCWPAEAQVVGATSVGVEEPGVLTAKTVRPRVVVVVTIVGVLVVGAALVFFSRRRSVEWRAHRMRNMGAELVGGPYMPLSPS